YIVVFLSFRSIMTIPFLGILRATEHFSAIAFIGILESLFKLGIAVMILNFAGNRLVIYALLLMLISAVSLLLYTLIVRKRYKMVRITFRLYDKLQAKEMFSFLSWSLLGSLA